MSDQGSAYVFVRSGGVWTQQQKLVAPDGAARDDFGFSVAISGETVVVGASRDDGAACENQGAAYVFVRSGGVWTLQQKLVAPDAVAGDGFGFSVAISGETVVVGAIRADGEAASLKARPMSLSAAVETGACSRSSRPRTGRQMTSSAPRWRSAGRQSWWARLGKMARRAQSGLGLCLCAQRWSLDRAAEAGGLGRRVI